MRFVQNLHFWSTFALLVEMCVLVKIGVNFEFLVNICIFSENVRFVQNLRFWSKVCVFGQNLRCCSKFAFLVKNGVSLKICVFGQNERFGQNLRYWATFAFLVKMCVLFKICDSAQCPIVLNVR